MKDQSLAGIGYTCALTCVYTIAMLAAPAKVQAQSCPASSTTTLNSYVNTYYPGSQATVSAGATTITLGNASTSGYGTTPISANDIVLIIQMQGAQITSTNGATYGDGTGTGSGYLNNANLLAGKMEYGVAAAAVALTGGTLTLKSGLVNSYKNANYGTDGQYRYQVIRIPVYSYATLGANIKPPGWNGTVGGVIDFYVSSVLTMNGYTIDASSAGFRGGGGKNYSNVGSGANTDFVALSTGKAGGSKGEGIAGTPIYLDSLNATALIVGTVEGYPNGSYDRGAPGNAGGGATDGSPNPANSNNSGGGGGGNGGAGGGGGNSWSSNLAVGGRSGAIFAQYSPSRLVMGGGGGAGSTDGGTGTPANGLASSGAPGGGIVIITAGLISGTGSILANGAPPNTTLANDGSGGGGAGGSILILTSSPAPGLTVTAKGSAGASNTGAGAMHGPGGGGGGGIVYSNQTLGSVSVTGGAAGTTAGAVNYGAAAGAAGISSQSISSSAAAAFPLNCYVLAVNSITASAINENGKVIVKWQAGSDGDTREYAIEKSADDAVFNTIATLPADITGAGSREYSYTDISAGNTTQKIYYRIRESDNAGNTFYSNTVAIQPALSAGTPAVAPNPASTSATLSIRYDHYSTASVRLTDLVGNPIRIRQYPIVPGMNALPLDRLQQLPNGMYALQICINDKTETIKLLIHH